MNSDATGQSFALGDKTLAGTALEASVQRWNATNNGNGSAENSNKQTRKKRFHLRSRTVNINIVCSQCSKEGIASFFGESVRDDGLYQGKCPAGHDVLLATQTLRHELLFEIALNAIRDHYYREAVTSFAASAERFYEFAIRVIVKSASVSPDLIEQAWKIVGGQSERQFGAYVFVYLSHFGRLPERLSNRMVELRNRVVHKGVLPDQDEAITFGTAVHKIIQEGIRDLRKECLKEVNAVLGEHVSAIATRMGDRYPRSFMVTPTTLNVIHDISSGYAPFQTLLGRLPPSKTSH